MRRRLLEDGVPHILAVTLYSSIGVNNGDSPGVFLFLRAVTPEIEKPIFRRGWMEHLLGVSPWQKSFLGPGGRQR